MNPINYTDIDVNKISIGVNKKTLISPCHFFEFKYNYGEKFGRDQMVITTPIIKLTRYGIPQLNQFHNSDNSRSYIKVPMLNNPENNIFREKLSEVDILAKGHLKNIFPSVAKKLSNMPNAFAPSIRACEYNYDSYDEDKPSEEDFKKDRPDYCKFKFMCSYGSDVYTRIYHGPNNTLTTNVTITEIEKLIPFNSSIKMNVLIDKLWVSKHYNTHASYSYGITYKVVQLWVIHELKPILNTLFDNKKFTELDNKKKKIKKIEHNCKNKSEHFEITLNESESESEDSESEEDVESDEGVEGEDADFHQVAKEAANNIYYGSNGKRELDIKYIKTVEPSIESNKDDEDEDEDEDEEEESGNECNLFSKRSIKKMQEDINKAGIERRMMIDYEAEAIKQKLILQVEKDAKFTKVAKDVEDIEVSEDSEDDDITRNLNFII